MAVKAKFMGFEELLKTLNDLGDVDTLEKMSYRATIAPAKKLREMVQANADADLTQHTGALHRGWAVKQQRIGTRRGYTVGMRFGKKGAYVRDAKGKRVKDAKGKFKRDDPFYWWFLEFGTVHLKHPGGFGFFRRAIKAWESEARSEVLSRGTAEVMRAARAAVNRHQRAAAKAA